MRRLIAWGLSVMILALGMRQPAYALTRLKVGGIYSDAWGDAQAYADSHASIGKGALTGSLYDLEVTAGNEVRIYLDAGLFANEYGARGSEGQGISLSQLNAGRISVYSKVAGGSPAIKEVSLDYERNMDNVDLPFHEGTSYIKIEFSNPFVSTREQPFDCTIQLRLRGEILEDTEIRVTGTLSNPRIEAEGGTQELSLEGGTVAEATGSSYGCRISLGEGFSLTADLDNGNEYYGIAQIEEIEEELSWQYPSLEMAYRIYQVGLEQAAKACRFDLPQVYQVYDASGSYLGNTEGPVPFSSRYYLSEDMLNEFADYMAGME